MSEILLPPNVPLHSASAQPLVWDGQRMVPSAPLLYPEFFVKTEEIQPHLDLGPRSSLPYNFGSGHLPALPTPQGLRFDPAWAPFSAFEDPRSSDRGPDMRIVQAVATGAIAWDLKCPAVARYESLLGHLIEQYGANVGGHPERPGMNALEFQYKNPVAGLLKGVSAEQLAAFEDRGRTLLDLACEHQQWHLAEFLWRRKGVRWSPSTLAEGKPLEALVVATRALQGSMVFTPNDSFGSPGTGQERVAWLETWLSRYEAASGATQPPPTLDYRARLAQLRGWQEGQSIRDTPAAFWIARFMEVPGPSGLPALSATPEYARDLVTTWCAFWGRAGVDLEQVSVPTISRETAQGFTEFWSTTKNAEPWSALVSSAWRHARLEVEAQSVNTAHRSSSSKRAL